MQVSNEGPRKIRSLAGTWRFRTDPEGLGEHFREQLDDVWKYDARWMEGEHNDSPWLTLPVPSCWQEHGIDYNGAAWYRTTFADPRKQADTDGGPRLQDSPRRLLLRFDGVDYFCDVWLNGVYLGSHEGFFGSFSFDITPHLRAGDENLLAVRVESPNDIRAKEKQQFQLKAMIKGALQRWDVNNPLVNPGGIWNDVSLITVSDPCIDGIRVSSIILDRRDDEAMGPAAKAELFISLRLHRADAAGVVGSSYSAGRKRLKAAVEVIPISFDAPSYSLETELTAAPGYSEHSLCIEIKEAHLWYSWDLGEPRRYHLVVRLIEDGKELDAVETTTGIRRIVRKNGWETFLNGIRVFQRGANYLSDQFLSSMDRARYEKDILLAKEANLNTLHPFCVVEKDEFYELCDEHGILVYQDFPMWLEMDNSSDLVRRATPQVDELIEHYGSHPSIIIWNFGSQPSKANFLKLGSALAERARMRDPERIVHRANALIDFPEVQQLRPLDPVGDFHWSKETALQFAEQHNWPIDCHLYYGWYYDKPMEAIRKVPKRFLELVTEYGAQALPNRKMLEKMISKEELFPPHWPAYSRRCFQEKEQFRQIERPSKLDSFITDSQEYQARFLKYHSEFYRINKFNPCNGIHMFCFNDCWEAITWSVVDYERNRKPGFYALRQSMEPLQLILEIPETRIHAPKARELDFFLFAVNDLPKTFEDLSCEILIEDAEGKPPSAETKAITIGAGSIEKIDTVRVEFGRAEAVLISLSLIQKNKKGGNEEKISKNSYLFRRNEDGFYELRYEEP